MPPDIELPDCFSAVPDDFPSLLDPSNVPAEISEILAELQMLDRHPNM